MYTTEKGSEILNTSFPANSRYNFSDDLLSLTITNLQETDEGNYTLMATNDAGNSSATYNLAAYSKNIICMQLHYVMDDFITRSCLRWCLCCFCDLLYVIVGAYIMGSR